MKDFLSPISNPGREKRQVKAWLAWNTDLIDYEQQQSLRTCWFGWGWRVSLSRLTEFFPNSILHETQGCAIGTCCMFSTLHVGARDILVTFDDMCPTSSGVASWLHTMILGYVIVQWRVKGQPYKVARRSAVLPCCGDTSGTWHHKITCMHYALHIQSCKAQYYC